jgi:hypothetical protein
MNSPVSFVDSTDFDSPLGLFDGTMRKHLNTTRGKIFYYSYAALCAQFMFPK